MYNMCVYAEINRNKKTDRQTNKHTHRDRQT